MKHVSPHSIRFLTSVIAIGLLTCSASSQDYTLPPLKELQRRALATSYPDLVEEYTSGALDRRSVRGRYVRSHELIFDEAEDLARRLNEIYKLLNEQTKLKVDPVISERTRQLIESAVVSTATELYVYGIVVTSVEDALKDQGGVEYSACIPIVLEEIKYCLSQEIVAADLRTREIHNSFVDTLSSCLAQRLAPLVERQREHGRTKRILRKQRRATWRCLLRANSQFNREYTSHKASKFSKLNDCVENIEPVSVTRCKDIQRRN